MKKPWEETWSAKLEDMAGYECLTDAHVVRNERGLRVCDFDVPRHGPDTEEVARAKFVSAAPDMARLLLQVETVDGGRFNYCPFCDWPGNGDHKDDCAWVAVMKKAGIR